MPVAIVTGSGGLIGSEAVRQLARLDYQVIGIENDMRRKFFGPEASTAEVTNGLVDEFTNFQLVPIDMRDAEGVLWVFEQQRKGKIDLVIHTAAQPSHDWAAKDPQVDFGVNANGTLNVLEATRRHSPEATFIHCSTSKVYGDTPNRLPLEVKGPRLDLPWGHEFYNGITPAMSIDQSLHSLFGASKLAGDVLVQEYGRYFGTPTVCFRPGCLTGPGHQGAELHGFLSYLMRCVVTERPYTIFGYGGLQVRDNIHASDLVSAFLAFHVNPRVAAVYNLGGGRRNSCSMLEAIAACEGIAGKQFHPSFESEPRIGDHKWFIGSEAQFMTDYPSWNYRYTLEDTLREIYDHNVEGWLAPGGGVETERYR